MRFILLVTLIISGVLPGPARGEDPADLAWEMLWERFRDPGTELFYDFISSYESGHHLAHLPTADEVKRQFPNPCGYGTGMEDSMILGGAVLSLLSDRYAVTGEEGIRHEIFSVFAGVERCLTVHGVSGFVARSVCPEDGKSVYINSSRDQYTHCIHGLWKFYHSPLCDEGHKLRIGELVGDIADRMTRNVVPENDYDSLRADGERDPLGISRMWNVQAHEAARLPMIYAVAAEVSGDQKYRDLYERYALPAALQSAAPSPNIPAYALLQMQCSLEVLYSFEKDPDLRSKFGSAMKTVAELAANRVTHVNRVLTGMSMEEKAMLPPAWREVKEWKIQGGYRIPQWGEYRHVWHQIREAGEANLVILMLSEKESSLFSRESLQSLIEGTNYAETSSCGIVYHLAAYWKARREGLW